MHNTALQSPASVSLQAYDRAAHRAERALDAGMVGTLAYGHMRLAQERLRQLMRRPPVPDANLRSRVPSRLPMDARTVQVLAQRTLLLGQESIRLRAAGAKMVTDNQQLRAEHRQLFTHVRQVAREQVHVSLRRIIRRKLFAGKLPLDSAPTLVARPGTGDLCDVCERPLRPAHMVVDVPAGERFVHLHADCFLLWDDERRKATRILNGAA